jgi:hypothetical protein
VTYLKNKLFHYEFRVLYDMRCLGQNNLFLTSFYLFMQYIKFKLVKPVDLFFFLNKDRFILIFLKYVNNELNYRKTSHKVKCYITGLPNGRSLRPYHWNFSECDMIFEYNFVFYTRQWDLMNFVY